MDEFEQSLRASLRRHAPRDVPIGLADRTAQALSTVSIPQPASARYRVRMSFAVGIAAVVVVLTLLVVSFAGGSLTPSPHSSPLAATTNTASPTAPPTGGPTGNLTPSPAASRSPTSVVVTPSPIPSPSPTSGWNRAYQPTGIVFTAAIEDGAGFLAIGADQTQVDTPRVWRSSDGLSWTPDAQSPAFVHGTAPGRLDEYVVHGLYRHDGVLVAVGADQAGDLSSGTAVAWYSSDDGMTWTRAQVSGNAHTVMYAATWGGGSWVSVGANGIPGMGVQLGNAHGPSVWRSSDGRSWTRVAGTPTDVVAIATSVAPLASGGFVAAGSQWGPLAGAPVWVSADGTTWRRLVHIHFFGATVNRIGDAVMVGGESPSGAAAIVQSSDGQTWSGDALGAAAGQGSNITAVAQLGPELIAIGSEPAGGDAYRLAVWSSQDGSQWAPSATSPGFDNAVPELAVASGGTLLVTGECDQDKPPQPSECVWVSTGH